MPTYSFDQVVSLIHREKSEEELHTAIILLAFLIVQVFLVFNITGILVTLGAAGLIGAILASHWVRSWRIKQRLYATNETEVREVLEWIFAHAKDQD